MQPVSKFTPDHGAALARIKGHDEVSVRPVRKLKTERHFGSPAAVARSEPAELAKRANERTLGRLLRENHAAEGDRLDVLWIQGR